MYDLIAILIPIVLAVCIVVVIKSIEDSRLKRRFVDANSDEAQIRAILSTDYASRRRSELKWGSVLISIGAGFALMALLGLDAEDPMSYALLFGTTGVGILVFRWLDPPAT